MPEQDYREAPPRGTRIDTLQLWRLLFSGLEGYLVTFVGRRSARPDARTNELDRTQQRYWRYPSDAAKAAAYLEAESEAGCDAYFGVHLFEKPGNRRKYNALDLVGAAWVDGDGAQVPGAWPQPKVIIESSPGRQHFYWPLEEPASPEEAALLSKRLTYAMGGDKGKWGLGTVLRAPGTMNYKREAPVEVTGVVTEARRCSRAELDGALPELPGPRRTLTAKPAVTSPRGGGGAVGPPVALSGKALDIYEGWAPIVGDSGVDRSATLMQIASVLFNAGLERPALVPALEERDRTLGFDKYTRRPAEYDRIVDKLEAGGRNTPSSNGSGSSGPPPAPPSHPGRAGGPHRLTDYGNAERLVDRHGEDVHYLYAWNKWLVWDERRWSPDDTGEVDRRAKDTVRSIYAEASRAPDEKLRAAIAKHAQLSESRGKIEAMVSHARSEPGIPLTVDALDGDPWAFNVANGTLDLRTGDLRPHDRADLITKLAPTDYDPLAEAPTWDAFLAEVLPSPEVRGYVQRLVGYALTGKAAEHVLPICHGTGANGKSTLLNTVLEMMGEYGLQAADDMLVVKGNAHPTEQADLFGRRYVTNMETEDGRRLAESRVKQLTGGDRVRARRMREDFWEFRPTHTLFLATNHKPEVRGTDHAIWRRLRLIPFAVTIPSDRQDKHLEEKLRAELPGILRWAVEGCLKWRRVGLREPDEVMAATKTYREEMDVLAAFLADRCVVHERATALATPLYHEYRDWSEQTGERVESQKKFGARLTERGFESRRRTSGDGKGKTEYLGVGILASDPPPDPPDGEGSSAAQNENYSCDSADESSDPSPRATGVKYWNPTLHHENPAEESVKVDGAGAAVKDGEPESDISSSKPPHEGVDAGKGSPSFTLHSGAADSASQATAAPAYEDVSASLERLLSDPPGWWRRQAEIVLREGSPGRLVKPLVSATAAEVLGSPLRHSEAREAVEQKLREMGAEEAGG